MKILDSTNTLITDILDLAEKEKDLSTISINKIPIDKEKYKFINSDISISDPFYDNNDPEINTMTDYKYTSVRSRSDLREMILIYYLKNQTIILN